MQSLPLATDTKGTWYLVFIAEELHLFIGLARRGKAPNPYRGYTVEDFLVALPRDDLQKAAHTELVRLLSGLVSEEIAS